MTSGEDAVRWSWDYPPPDSSFRGRTVILDGWMVEPQTSEIAVVSAGEILVTSTARHPRPDAAASLGLTADAVGFHLEADVRQAVADGRVTIGLCIRSPGREWRTLEERTFHTSDPEPLPYELGFRWAEDSTAVLQRVHIYASGPPVSELFPEMLGIVRRYAGSTVLDLGFGTGPYAAALRETARVVYGVEYAEESVRLARQRALSVVRADGRRLPLRSGSCDSVVAVEVLEHIERPEEALKECARVTRRNVIVSVPNAAVIPHLFPWGVVPWHLLEATHVNFFSARTLEHLMRQSFEHVVVGYYARSFIFPGAPPLYAHLFGVAAHEAAGLMPVEACDAHGGRVRRAMAWATRRAATLWPQ